MRKRIQGLNSAEGCGNTLLLVQSLQSPSTTAADHFMSCLCMVAQGAL